MHRLTLSCVRLKKEMSGISAPVLLAPKDPVGVLGEVGLSKCERPRTQDDKGVSSDSEAGHLAALGHLVDGVASDAQERRDFPHGPQVLSSHDY